MNDKRVKNKEKLCNLNKNDCQYNRGAQLKSRAWTTRYEQSSLKRATWAENAKRHFLNSVRYLMKLASGEIRFEKSNFARKDANICASLCCLI